jgi:hypothetical protein
LHYTKTEKYFRQKNYIEWKYESRRRNEEHRKCSTWQMNKNESRDMVAYNGKFLYWRNFRTT